MTGSLEALLIWAPILRVFGLAVAGGLYLYILRQPAGTGALQEMIAPGLTALLVPPIIGLLLGKAALGDMLAGAMLSGVLLVLLMANAGGGSRPGFPLPLNACHSGGAEPYTSCMRPIEVSGIWSRLQARTSPSETRRRTRHDSSTLPPARLDFVARL